jgi:two-component system CheB/CheR fusion protein
VGLALTKGLIEQHGGEIEARSAGLGLGAEFTIRLPLVEPPAAHPAAARRPSNVRRILVIEDNVDAANSLRESLVLSSYEVDLALDGPSGIRKARESKPDVVLCDIGLTGMDGYAVARAIRADPELRTVHLVAVTGYAQPEDLREALDAGFEQHVAKPATIEKLQAVLAEVTRRSTSGASS